MEGSLPKRYEEMVFSIVQARAFKPESGLKAQLKIS